MSPAVPTIPTIDLSTATGEELVDALIANSCVFLIGHGAVDKIARVLDTSREFFDLPREEKDLVRWGGELPWQGFQPVHEGGPQAMLLERFEINLPPDARTDAGGTPVPLDEWADTFSQWPERPGDLREAWVELYAHHHQLATRLTHLIAGALELPDADLPAWTSRQHANMVCNHYLAQDEEPEPGRVRQRPHTDIGGFTLLWADDSPGGLEAKIGPDGTWVPVWFPPGAILLQVGDLLHRWSRGRIPANDHRVVNPEHVPGQTAGDRFSIVYFQYPDRATWVAPDEDVEAMHTEGHLIDRMAESDLQDAGVLAARLD
jgi:isopenicillin N synthase-like dioxygenase